MEPRVVDAPERARFEIIVDERLAGFAQYSRSEDEISLTHTEIDPAFEGQGLGSTCCRIAPSSGVGLPSTTTMWTWCLKASARSSACSPRGSTDR
jgi:hypothetical protein